MSPSTKHSRAPRFFTVNEVAEALGVSSKTIQRRIRSGEIVTHRIGRQLRISDADFQDYVRKQRVSVVSF